MQLNDAVDIPLSMDMGDFVASGTGTGTAAKGKDGSSGSGGSGGSGRSSGRTSSISSSIDSSSGSSSSSSSSSSYSSSVYDLTSIVIHEGSLNYGHYYALVRPDLDSSDQDKNERWIMLNDKQVAVISQEDVLALGRKNGYLLFYTRRST